MLTYHVSVLIILSMFNWLITNIQSKKKVLSVFMYASQIDNIPFIAVKLHTRPGNIINSTIVLPYRLIFANARGARAWVCNMAILSYSFDSLVWSVKTTGAKTELDNLRRRHNLSINDRNIALGLLGGGHVARGFG